jgi:3'-phosphoadenosine 5'-phosphosulfate sulfotransferase (PAPS reductase)/FAD synthetase
MKLTIQELKQRQKWTLNQKIDHTLGVLDQFFSYCGGIDKTYIAFSGGKDSTVLLDIARMVFGQEVKGMFTNTGLEFPDIVKFVRMYDNVDITRPSINHKKVIEQWGFPLVSKDVASLVHKARYSPHTVIGRIVQGSMPDRGAYKHTLSDIWKFLLNKTYNTSDKCCYELKKKPAHKYEKETGRFPIVGTMADESAMRAIHYRNRGGCNTFGKVAKSLPISIWTERDIWDYIKMRNIPISEIYHKGAKRTGCMFCGFGCQFKNDNRFQLLIREEPKAYAHCMSLKNNGVSYREALRDVLSVNGLYLPDEQPKTLFDFTY